MGDVTLEGILLIEKDDSSDVMAVWEHPSATPEMEAVVINKTTLEREKIAGQTVFSKYKNSWLYIFTIGNDCAAPLTSVLAFSICIITSDYHPEKYLTFAKLLAQVYQKTGSTVKLMEGYLSAFLKGKYPTAELGSYNSADHNLATSLLATPLSNLVNYFGTEIILVWVALMMKKRIIVFSEKVSNLLRVLRGLPLLVWHRQCWSDLRPFVTQTALEIEELSSAAVYIAGFTDETIKTKTELYDLFIDVDAKSISVAEHAKTDFLMGKFHKNIAMKLINGAKDDAMDDQTLIKQLAADTKELLSKLNQLKGDNKYLSWDIIQSVPLPPHMDKFLFSVASAEGLTAV